MVIGEAASMLNRPLSGLNWWGVVIKSHVTIELSLKLIFTKYACDFVCQKQGIGPRQANGKQLDTLTI